MGVYVRVHNNQILIFTFKYIVNNVIMQSEGKDTDQEF
jgi:hypothetical protein